MNTNFFCVHPTLKNKPSIFQSEHASNWTNRSGTIQQLAEQVLAGRSFIPAEMTSHHRSNSAFSKSSLVVVDVDNGLTIEEFKNHDLAKQAAYLYTTASHDPSKGKERFRILFQLPTVIEDPKLYKSLVTLLVKQTQADEACTDVCRIFYGNDQATEPIKQFDAVLSQDYIDEAKRLLLYQRQTYNREASQYDERAIDQAIFCLEHVIEPSEDNDYNRYKTVTAAAASAGDVLYQTWSDWASRCHHGNVKGGRQNSERYYYGFKGSTLFKIFQIATEDRPGWRKDLPEELRDTNTDFYLGVTGDSFAGYDHGDFTGEDDDDTPEIEIDSTQGLFSSPPPTETATLPAPTQPTERTRTPARRGGGNENEDTPRRIRELLLQRFNGLRLNQMNQQLEYGPNSEPREVHDPTHLYIHVSEGQGTVFPKTLVFDLAQVIGHENQYHPVRSYLDYCQRFEPCPYFNHLASELLGVSNDPIQNPIMPNGMRLADVIMKRFFIGAVARVMQPGCRHDWMPILIGDQNCGKTTFFQYLTPQSLLDGTYPWVTTMQQGIEYLKEKPHALHSGFIVVMDEFERYTKRKYVEELKNLVSVSVDRSARKYENEKSYPRSFVLAGATNNTDFLVDPSGNRRFLPIIVEGKVASKENPNIKIIDLDRLKRDRNSIWAAAYAHYCDQPVHVFTSNELNHVSDFTDSFTRDNPIDAKVIECVQNNTTGYTNDGSSYVTLHDIYNWLEIPITQHRQMSQDIIDCLKRMDYKNKKIKKNGKQMRVWIKK